MSAETHFTVEEARAAGERIGIEWASSPFDVEQLRRRARVHIARARGGMTADPTQQVFWLASRAVGIVAIALLSISVALGLAMSTKLLRRPGLPAKQALPRSLDPRHADPDRCARRAAAGRRLPATGARRRGAALPLSYRPLWTGTGIIAAWLAAILGLSFYTRKWIGAKTWRWLHRWTLAVYVLAVGEAIGAGTDGRSTWMLAMLTLLTAPIVFAFSYRMLPTAPRQRPPQAASQPVRRHAAAS